MKNASDFGALNWVKDELDATIRQARRALEIHVEEQGDENALERCADHLHQIAGVLQMVQVYGPGMLAEEMELVVRAMAEGHVRQQEDAAEALMLALIQLPDYLETIQTGEADIPLIILPLLNDLRAVREAPLLSEAALFKPEIEGSPLADRITGEANPQLPVLVQQLRQKFHLGLLSWYRKQQEEKGWRNLLQVFDELEQHAGTRQVHRLSWVAGALMRGLIEGSITSGIAIKQLFSKIDRQLKRIIDDGEEALVGDPPDDLLKNLLYYIAQADSSDPRLLEVKQAYELETVLPSEAELAQGRQGLTGSNAELAASVNEAISTELTRVKDVLDLFMRDQQAPRRDVQVSRAHDAQERPEQEMLGHLEKPLRKLADILGMIGQGALRSRLLRQADRVVSFQGRANPPEDFELMEMAGDILYVESSLSTMQTVQSSVVKRDQMESGWGLDLPEGEYANLIKQTVREAKVDISKAKEAIISYTEANDPVLLEAVHASFIRVYGALKVLDLRDSAQIIERTADFIRTRLIDDKEVPDRQQLNSLADVISSIEYYLEALVDGAGDRREIIAIAQSALNGLFKAQPEILEKLEASAEIIPLAASLVQDRGRASATEEPLRTDQVLTGGAAEEAATNDDIPIASADKPALEDIDPEILEIFVEEAREELETIQQDLPAWQKNQENKNALISFRRSFHTLKGSGRLVGAKVIGELAWSVENMLNRMIDETIKATPEMMVLLDDVLEILPVLIDCQEKSISPEVDVERLMKKAFALADGRAIDELTASEVSNKAVEVESRVVLETTPVETYPSDTLNAFSGSHSVEESYPAESVDEIDIDTIDLDAEELAHEAAGEDVQVPPEPGPVQVTDGSGIVNLPVDQETSATDDLQKVSGLGDYAEEQISEDFTDSDLRFEIDSELLEVFSEEAESHLAALEGFVEQARVTEPRPEITDELVRACHTLHGSARMAGFLPIANLSKSVEDYLKTLSEMNRRADDGVLELLGDVSHQIRKHLQRLPQEFQGEPDSNSYLTTLTATQDAVLKEISGELEGDAPVISSAEIGMEELTGNALATAANLQEDDSLLIVGEDPELLEIFLEEARELLDSIQRSFTGWLQARDNPALIEAIQRALHTLKGSARLAGVSPVGDLSYVLERIFSAWLEGRVQSAELLIDTSQQAINTLAVQLNEAQSGRVRRVDDLVKRLESALEMALSQPSAESAELDVLETKAVEEADSLPTDREGPADIVDSEPLAHEDASAFYEEPLSFLQQDDLFDVGEDPELLGVFVEESQALIETLKSDCQQLHAGPHDNSRYGDIQRVLHTLKGSARLAGVLPVGDLSHALESLFDLLAEERIAISGPLLEAISQAVDLLSRQIHEADSVGQVQRADSLIQHLETLQLEAREEDAQSLGETEAESGLFRASEFDSAGREVDEHEQPEDLYEEPLSFLQEDTLVDVAEDPELVEIFIEEAREFMERLESAFQRWTSNTEDHAIIDSMQRSLHTLKGSARLAGIAPVGDLSHAVESLLIRVAEGAVESNEILLHLIQQALDKLANQLDEISTSGKVSLADEIVQRLGATQPSDVIQEEHPSLAQGSIGAIEETEESDEQSTEVEFQVQDQSGIEKQQETAVVLPFVSEIAKRVESREKSPQVAFKPTKDQVRINADLMDRLVNNAGEVSIYRARLEQQNGVLGFNLAEMEQTVSRLFTQLRNLEIETEAQILYRWERDSEKDDREKAAFDPLELDRFSTMQQLSRALMETVSDLSSINGFLTDLQRETDTLLLQQSRISTDLQDGLLRTRMVPFVQLVPRMQRLVRQTAEQLEKKAHLECFGSEGELDRNILNRMIPVLEHLLRNAVSHGIELPSEREMVDKDETGRISLYIDREASDVLITLSDDGRGLDINAIHQQAIAQGILKEGVEISDDDLMQCVLTPGFSTAKEVTQIAGRGVGLDVVASEVKQLGGSLDIDSQPGRGTSFTIRLPLTLAITDALLVRVGEEIYAIPHGGVEGVVRIRRQELAACYAGERSGYQYAQRNFKTSYLGRMLGTGQAELPENTKWFPLLLVHAGKHHVALQVDELMGTRQIVVKSVGKQVGSVRWITGGTILADGRVALILDVGALVRMDAANLPSVAPGAEAARKQTEERIRVMVVDDSITVRKVTGRLLERHNMDVVTAKDGVEAVALLQEQVPDIMLLDIEMPRMDGFELARHINNSVDYYGLPIIMISSRVGEKHRQRAFDLGVKRCLGKPYQESELLENINEVLAEETTPTR